jgi:hypothetical protein
MRFCSSRSTDSVAGRLIAYDSLRARLEFLRPTAWSHWGGKTAWSAMLMLCLGVEFAKLGQFFPQRVELICLIGHSWFYSHFYFLHYPLLDHFFFSFNTYGNVDVSKKSVEIIKCRTITQKSILYRTCD